MLVERVQAAVVTEIQRQTDGSWPTDMNGDETIGLVDDHLEFPPIARAAIEAVFDWLAEPSYSAIDAGLDCGPDRDCETYWVAMLAAMRKEALG